MMYVVYAITDLGARSVPRLGVARASKEKKEKKKGLQTGTFPRAGDVVTVPSERVL